MEYIKSIEDLIKIDEIFARASMITNIITQTDVALANQKSALSQFQFKDTRGFVRPWESWKQCVVRLGNS
ncbi:hypothetical protein [Acinetobacter terrae]|uniref:Uncharacterized protein n=1 Tax=Acinetobacter terrae TaxID=2731247 RepID=A0ABX1UZD1_9GAMM|nr:hypothetical protein [Acinetobacter terrae]NNH86760.1 hypothetical protein [Acinetobacter terrae]